MNTIADLKLVLTQAGAADPIAITLNGQTLMLNTSDLAAALGANTAPNVAYRATTTNRLKLHDSPALTANVLETMAVGELMAVLDTQQVIADGLAWANVRAPDNQTGWCAVQYLAPILVTGPAPSPASQPSLPTDPSAPVVVTPSAPVQPTVPTARRLVGLHILQDGASKALSFAQKLTAAGKPLPSATVINDANLATQLAAGNVRYVVYRYLTGSGDDPSIPTDDASALVYGQVFTNQRLALPAGWNNLKGDNIYVQIANEVKWTPGHAGFWQGVMQALEAHGRKAAICAYAVGQPEPNEWQTLTTTLQYAAAHGHIVVLHSYCALNTPIGELSTDGSDYELRFVRLYNSVPKTARPMLVISEFAHEFTRGKFEGTDALLKITGLYQAAIAPYSYVAGFNLYTAGKLGGWDTSCIDSALDPLSQWVFNQ
ncbi:MAG: SH3 domain-containing protein [Aggregatilineales bacterium]